MTAGRPWNTTSRRLSLGGVRQNLAVPIPRPPQRGGPTHITTVACTFGPTSNQEQHKSRAGLLFLPHDYLPTPMNSRELNAITESWSVLSRIVHVPETDAEYDQLRLFYEEL